MKNKHTPGPWKIRKNIIDAPDAKFCIVDYPFPIKKQSEERQANTKLIAAAPELLDAVNAAFSYLLPLQCELLPKDASTTVVLHLLKAAIKKATINFKLDINERFK